MTELHTPPASNSNLLRLFIDQAPVSMAMFDRNMRYLAVSRRYLHDLRVTVPEVIGRSHYEIFPELPEHWRAIHERCLQGATENRREESFPRADGSVDWLRWEIQPWRDEHGQIGGLILFCEVVSDRKHAEQHLGESVELQGAVLAALSAQIAVLDRTGTIIAVNPAWEEFARRNQGQPARCGVGVNYFAACRTSDAFAEDDIVRIVRGLRSVLAGEVATFNYEYPCHSPDEQRWFSLQATPLQLPGGGLVVSHTNITQRVQAEHQWRQSEERLRAVLDATIDAIVTIDQRGIIQSVNPATERMFGYSATELIGQNVKLLMPAPWHHEHDDYLARYQQTQIKHIIGIGREVEARRKDGSVFPVELVVNEIDHMHMYVGMMRDVTRQKELEREVVEIASLEQRRIGQDLHDTVGQELTALNLMADDLSEIVRTDPSGGEHLARKMKLALQRCQRELRSVMRGLLPVAVDSTGLMASLADLAERVQYEGKANCTFHCPQPISIADNLTATHLYLIAQEAVHNAVKHARPKQIEITLENNPMLELSVRDDGLGIKRLPTKWRGGLGVRIMHNRAAIIGAKLTIEPLEPRGTLVRCTLLRRDHETHTA